MFKSIFNFSKNLTLTENLQVEHNILFPWKIEGNLQSWCPPLLNICVHFLQKDISTNTAV